MSRGCNKSFYHYYINELNEEGKYEEPIFFATQRQICDKYNISRNSVYKLLNNEDLVMANFPHRIHKIYIHKSVINFIE